MIIKLQTNKIPTLQDIAPYESLLPNLHTLSWLSFLLALARAIHADLVSTQIEFSYQNHTLTIYTPRSLFLAKEKMKQLIKPASFAIVVKDIG